MKSRIKSVLALVAVLIALIGSAFAGGKVSPPPPGPVLFNPLPGAWKIDYSKGMGAKPRALANGWWMFDFPTAPGQVGYVTQDISLGAYVPVCTTTVTPTAITNTVVTIVATIEVTASQDCVFDFHTNPDNTGPMPSSARFYIENSWSNDNYVRWWATGANCLVLADGRYQYTVTMDPSSWSDTWGQNGAGSAEATAGFYTAMAAPHRIGFTFGGGSFYGHGVNLLSGSATFEVYNITFVSVTTITFR